MVTITHKVISPAGVALDSRVSVVFSLVAGKNPTTHLDRQLVTSIKVAVGYDGNVSADLIAQSDIIPSNSYYKIETFVDGRLVDNSRINFVMPDVGPVSLLSVRLLDTEDLPDYNVLDSHVLSTTAVHGIADTADLVVTSDSRLTDSRTPTVHAASHAAGADDELEVAGRLMALADMDLLVAYDTFRRADGLLGTSDSGHAWTVNGGIFEILNEGVRPLTSVDSIATIAAGFKDGQSIEAVGGGPNQTGGATSWGLVGAYLDDDNYLRCTVDRGNINVHKKVAGVMSLVASGTTSWSYRLWSRLRFDVGTEAYGDYRLNVYINDNRSILDASIPSADMDLLGTNAGMYFNHVNNYIRNFAVKNVRRPTNERTL